MDESELPAAGQPEPVGRPRCGAQNRRGIQCRMAPLVGKKQCFIHDPESAPERARARLAGGHARRTPDGERPNAVHLRTVPQIQAELEREYACTLMQENSARRATTVAALLALALRILEVGSFADRLTAVEARLSETQSPLRRVI